MYNQKLWCHALQQQGDYSVKTLLSINVILPLTNSDGHMNQISNNIHSIYTAFDFSDAPRQEKSQLGYTLAHKFDLCCYELMPTRHQNVRSNDVKHLHKPLARDVKFERSFV